MLKVFGKLQYFEGQRNQTKELAPISIHIYK